MVGETTRFTFRQCSCGRLERGTDFKKHLSKVGKDGTHKEKLSLIACIPCLQIKAEDMEKVDFFSRHKECDSGNKRDKRFVALVEPLLHPVDLDQGALQVALPPAMGDDEETKAAVATILEAAEEVREDLALSSSGSSSSSDDEVETHCSPAIAPLPSKASTPQKRGILAQCKKWSADDAKAVESQRTVITRLTDKISSQRKVITELTDELERKKAKECLNGRAAKEAIELRERLRMLEAKMAESARREEKAQKEKDEMRKDLEMEKEKNAGLEKEKEVLGRQVNELSIGMSEKEVLIHLPIHGDRIIDRPLISKDLDMTMDCYEDSESGVRCAHLNVFYHGHLRKVRCAKTRRVRAGK